MTVRRIVRSVMAALLLCAPLSAQVNTDRMMSVGRTALYFDNYVLSIQYFNQVISAKPYMYEPFFYRAVAKLSLEDYRGAETDCTSSLERNPFVVNSYQVRGLAKVYQERYDDAAADFMSGLHLDPENVSLRHNLILCQARGGHMDEAFRSVDTLMSIAPKYTPAMAMRSDMLWDRGDTAGAVEWIDRAIVLDRYDADLLHHRGILFARMEEFARAEPDLDKAIYLDPANAGLYINRAMVRYCQDNLNGALDDYDMAIVIDPSNVTARYNRGNLRGQIGDDNRAIQDFDMVIEAEPDNMMAIFNRGILRYNTGDLRGAENDISAVLAQYPQFVMGYQFRSQVREGLGDRRGAEQDALVVLKEQNSRFNNPDADKADESDDGKTRGSSDRNMRNYRKIIVDDNLENSTGFSSEYRGKVQNRNVEVQYLELYRLTYFRTSDPQSGPAPYISRLESINTSGVLMSDIVVDKADTPLDVNRINMLFSDIERCTSLLADDPFNADVLVARALDFCLLQDIPSSESDLMQAVERSPESWTAWFCLAQLHARELEMKKAERDLDLQNGQKQNRDNMADPGYQKVLRELDEVIGLVPDCQYAYYNRGTVHALVNDMHAALVDFDRAIELDATLAEAWYNRGLVLVMLNRMDDAFRDLSKAGELGIYSAYNIIKRFSKAD